jgi:hypothetical protein
MKIGRLKGGFTQGDDGGDWTFEKQIPRHALAAGRLRAARNDKPGKAGSSAAHSDSQAPG